MAVSRKPRHWIPLPLTIAWTTVAVMRAADFSGEPAPRWQTITLTTLGPLCLLLVTLNAILDRRDPEQAE